MSEPHSQHPGTPELPPTVASSEEGANALPAGDLVGRILGGRYRILRKLGEGAMGAVYLGEHLKIGRQDAIKVLRDSLATDADTIARFVRGTRNVSMIRHPNVCTIYDYSDTADGIQFLAMEFVPGETLRDLLQREGKLPLPTAVHVARQAAEALDAAHEMGIVHRDLKPANIMVVPGRGGVIEVKVVDFDIAKGSRDGEGEEVTRMGFVVGTPEYMSPEQLIGDRLDGRSDIYSLALVLYRMLTGTLPFAAQDTQDLMVKRLTEEPMTLAGGLPEGVFPPALEAAVRRALQRKPAERQATAGEFSREIGAAVGIGDARETAGSRHAAPSPNERAKPKKVRRPVPMVAKAGGAAAVLVLLLVAGLLAFGGDDEPRVAATPLERQPPQVIEYDDPVSSSSDGPATGEPVEEEGEPRESPAPPPESNGTNEPTTTAAGSPPSPGEDELLLMLERVMESTSPRSTLLAVRDTAADTWADPSVLGTNRALAAYVAGSTMLALGDTVLAVNWLQRAVDLRPEYQPYRTELNLYQGLLSGN